MRTEQTLNRIVELLQSNCGDIFDASRRAGVSMVFINQWCKDDPIVAEALKEAQHFGTQMLYTEAVRRAVEGVEEDIYYKGTVAGQKRVYSDSLLTTLMKAKLPEFGKDAEGGTHVTVNVANIMPRADNYEAWLEMKTQTLAATALPPPEEIREAEYVELAAPQEPESVFAGIEL